MGKIIIQQHSRPLNLLRYHNSSIQLISDTHKINFILNPKETGHPLQVRNTCKALTCTMIYNKGVNVVVSEDKVAKGQAFLRTSVVPVSFHSTNAQYSIIKQSGHSPPSSAKVKNKWHYISTSPVYLRGIYRDNFTFITQG